jgi:hypothetical protein
MANIRTSLLASTAMALVVLVQAAGASASANTSQAHLVTANVRTYGPIMNNALISPVGNQDGTG